MFRAHLYVLVISLVAALLVLSSAPVQAKTYRDGKTYTLTGKLRRRSYRHGGNGSKIIGYTLELNKKIKITSTRIDTFKGKELDINTNLLSRKQYSKIKKWVGKKITVKGRVMIPDSPWWWYNGAVIIASKITKQ